MCDELIEKLKENPENVENIFDEVKDEDCWKNISEQNILKIINLIYDTQPEFLPDLIEILIQNIDERHNIEHKLLKESIYAIKKSFNKKLNNDDIFIYPNKLFRKKIDSREKQSIIISKIIKRIINGILQINEYSVHPKSIPLWKLSFRETYDHLSDKINLLYSKDSELYVADSRIDINETDMGKIIDIGFGKLVFEDDLYTWLNTENTEYETYFLIGNLGSGKTTYVKHNIIKYLNNNKAILIYMDFRDKTENLMRTYSGLTDDRKWNFTIMFSIEIYKHIIDILGDLDEYSPPGTSNKMRFLSNLEERVKYAFRSYNKEKSMIFNVIEMAKENPVDLLKHIIKSILDISDNYNIIIVLDNLDDSSSVELHAAACDLMRDVCSREYDMSVKSIVPFRPYTWKAMLEEYGGLNNFGATFKECTFIIEPIDLIAIVKKRLKKLRESGIYLPKEDIEFIANLEKGNVDFISRDKLEPKNIKYIKRFEENIFKILDNENLNTVLKLSNFNLRIAAKVLKNFFSNPNIYYRNNQLIKIFNKKINLTDYEFKRLLFFSMMENDEIINIFEPIDESCSKQCLCQIKLLKFLYKNDSIKINNLLNLFDGCSSCNIIKNYINNMLYNEYIFSSTGHKKIEDLLGHDGKIFLSVSGKYLIEELLYNQEYISVMKYYTKLPSDWIKPIFWESPYRSVPLPWKLCSNLQFIYFIYKLENICYISDKNNIKNIINIYNNISLEIYDRIQIYLLDKNINKINKQYGVEDLIKDITKIKIK